MMTAQKLANDLLVLDTNDIVEYIGNHRAAIRTLFLSVNQDQENKKHFAELVTLLCTKGFTKEEYESDNIQSLFVHLAYFFIKSGEYEYIDSCRARIENKYFKYRLNARRKYTKYHTFSEHIQQFESYLDLLAKAQAEIEDGNFNELLRDLQEYYDYACAGLDSSHKEELERLLNSEELSLKYQLVDMFKDREGNEISDLDLLPYNGVEYEPSDFSNGLFNQMFMDEIRDRSGAGFPNVLLGYGKDEVRYNIIKQGQAEFDDQYQDLSPQDIVKLYCYFNMRMHFFSSLSLFKRISTLKEYYYNTSGKIKFLDVGCGPATSGVAFIDYLHDLTDEDVIFDYYAIDSSDRMLEKAREMMFSDAYPITNHMQTANRISDISLDEFESATCIIINFCFVFASSTLGIDEMADYINKLVARYPYIPKYILYQNSVKERLNTNYEKFKDMLGDYKIETNGKETIFYHNKQNAFFNPNRLHVYYELIKLP